MNPAQRFFAIPAEPKIHLIARPTGGGFFPLSELNAFVRDELQPVFSKGTEETVLLDFSQVQMWDVAALLWLTIALHYYRKEGLSFRLKLPESKLTDPPSIALAMDRSAEFLRRWKFDDALRNITADPSDILVREQAEYFSVPNRHYRAVTRTGPQGVEETLLSKRLLQIRNLADPTFLGQNSVTSDRITACMADFQAARIGDILAAQCGMPKKDADLFSDHLLSESLQNVKDHPGATVGLVAIAVMGSSHELVLAVADNGKSIPETIYPTWLEDDEDSGMAREQRQGDLKSMDPTVIGEITHYATRPGKSSKKEPNHGMGLTYIKEDTVNTFNGKLRIVSHSTCVRYEGGKTDKPTRTENWEHPWPGNLLRLAIPLKRSFPIAPSLTSVNGEKI